MIIYIYIWFYIYIKETIFFYVEKSQEQMVGVKALDHILFFLKFLLSADHRQRIWTTYSCSPPTNGLSGSDSATVGVSCMSVIVLIFEIPQARIGLSIMSYARKYRPIRMGVKRSFSQCTNHSSRTATDHVKSQPTLSFTISNFPIYFCSFYLSCPILEKR